LPDIGAFLRLPRFARRPAGRRLNLALQGGGAHGAFTWGVLERLLEEESLTFDSVSGTSAGALNAVGLAAGLQEGGREGAQALLDSLWTAVSEKAQRIAPTAVQRGAFQAFSRVLSPYQFNPLDFNPLRDVLEAHVDFKRLGRESPVALYIAATDVASGDPRVFTGKEISAEAILASTCLPQLHHAVKIGQRHYWDGGFSSNPPLLPLILDASADDTLLIQLDPKSEADLPRKPSEIALRINRITFNGPMRRDLETIALCQQVAGRSFGFGNALQRRFRRHRLHSIEAERYTRKLGQASKLTPEWDLLVHLKTKGRRAAGTWLRKNADTLAVRRFFV